MVVHPVLLAQPEQMAQQVLVVYKAQRDRKELSEHKAPKEFKALRVPLVSLVQLELQDQVVLPDRKELLGLWVYRV
jgi:hypothetical protein